jgi:DNA-directed RNA polymerase specialized sigma24 family protein
MKTKSSSFDGVVARYYPAVYSLAARLTDDPRAALALTKEAFRNAQKQLRNLHNQAAVATVLLTSVLRAGLLAA